MTLADTAKHWEALAPNRSSNWQLKTRTLTFGACPALMGIVNVTPDSFSDGGRFFDPQRAIDHGLQMAAEGATLLDIGGESTRPFATPVEASEEIRRVVRVVQALAEQCDVPISIDTSKAIVAAEGVAAGAEVINDVTGFESAAMLEVALQTHAGICAMHMQGTPATMQNAPSYQDVVQEIAEYLRLRFESLQQAGIGRTRICLDPGIGFGKSHQHNLTLLGEMETFHRLGAPLLVGHSRKGFLAKILGDKESDRTAASNGVTLSLALQGVQVIRVHDVLSARQALLSFKAVGAIDGQVLSLG